MLSTILKQSKTNCYNHYFETNWNSIKNTWKGIKSILNIKSISADNLKSLTVDVPLFPIFSTTVFLQLLAMQRVMFHFHINIFQIFLKIDPIFPFLQVPQIKRK